jgi:hypothetical protein
MNLTPIKANMTEVDFGDVTVLFSYKTPVALRNNMTGNMLKTAKRWSNTTSRHISQWGAKDAPTKPQEYFDTLMNGKVA